MPRYANKSLLCAIYAELDATLLCVYLQTFDTALFLEEEDSYKSLLETSIKYKFCIYIVILI